MTENIFNHKHINYDFYFVLTGYICLKILVRKTFNTLTFSNKCVLL